MSLTVEAVQVLHFRLVAWKFTSKSKTASSASVASASAVEEMQDRRKKKKTERMRQHG